MFMELQQDGDRRDMKISKSQIVVMLFLFISIHSYGQMKSFVVKWNLPDTIHMIYDKYLLPPMKGADLEIVSFWSNYNDQPEYTLRITIGEDNQHYLEGRFLTQSIGEITNNLVVHPEKPLSIEVKFFSIPVSDTFALNMRSTFVKTIDCKKLNKVYEGPWALDGVYYNFRINNDNHEILESSLYEPEESNPCYKLVVLCKQMANDLKNNSFEELKYNDTFK